MNQRTVLVVEDNPDDEALTLRALRASGYPVDIVVAHDGAEALDYLFGTGAHANRKGTALPHWVLLDLKLPKVDGFDVLERLRGDSRARSLCVVVFTSSREEQDIARAYNLGCNSFVSKPVAYEQYVEKVRSIGRYWLQLNEAPSTRESQE